MLEMCLSCYVGRKHLAKWWDYWNFHLDECNMSTQVWSFIPCLFLSWISYTVYPWNSVLVLPTIGYQGDLALGHLTLPTASAGFTFFCFLKNGIKQLGFCRNTKLSSVFFWFPSKMEVVNLRPMSFSAATCAKGSCSSARILSHLPSEVDWRGRLWMFYLCVLPPSHHH